MLPKVMEILGDPIWGLNLGNSSMMPQTPGVPTVQVLGACQQGILSATSTVELL